MTNRLVFVLFVLWGCSLSAPPAQAQPYPAKAIRFIVPYPPGGGTDLFARTLAPALSEGFGQQVVVENRAGAQGNIGVAAVAKATPDGYTIGLTDTSTLTMNPWLYANPGFHPLNEFSHISLGVTYPNAVVIHPSVPAKSLKELAALARARPNELTFASASALSQLTGEHFKILTGVKMLHIPYKGAGPATIDLVGGHVNVMFATAASSVPMIRAGKTRAIAVTGPARIPALPNVPTSAEAGYPNFEVVGWFALAAPPNTPREILARLNREVRRALGVPAIAESLVTAGLDPKSTSPEEMTALVKADLARWGNVVKAVGILPQ